MKSKEANALRRPKPIHLVEGALLLSVLILMILLIPPLMDVSEDSGHPIHAMDGWYRMEAGQKTPVSLPDKLAMDENGALTLYFGNLSTQDASLSVTTAAAAYDLEILLDDEIIYRYSDALFPRNKQMRGKLYCTAMLPADTEGRQLALHYSGEPGEICQIPLVYIGGSVELQRFHFRESIPVLFIVTVMVICALVAFIIGQYLRVFHNPDPRLNDLSFFLLLCALWCLTDSPLVRLYSRHSSAISMVSFFAFMLFSIPMVRLISHTGEMKKYRALEVIIALLYVNAAVQGLLNYFHIFSMIDMLIATHILLFVGVTLCILLLFKEYRASKDHTLLTVLRAFTMLGGSGILALVLYWALEISNYELIFECGILAFSIVMFNETIRGVMRTFHYKTEMEVYRKLAKEDQMTGLGNRRAFEEYIDEVTAAAARGKDAALLFLDLNHLKHVNDRYGHNSGDEMIIGMALCLDKAFSSIGRCFRVGGDEFAVIFPSPKESEKDWNQMLDKAMTEYNMSARNPLSAVWGVSYLLGPDKHAKRASDWKFEADQKMYQQKGRRSN